MVAAAIIGGAVVGAAGSAYAGSQAASATTSASNAAIGEQQQALAAQEALAAPYTQLGESAMPLYEQLLGIGGGPSVGGPGGSGARSATAGGITYTMRPGGTMVPQLAAGGASPGAGTGASAGGDTGILAALEKTPGYQFTLSQGETGILNAASAQGGVSGDTLAALDKYNSGLADSTYQSVLGDVQGAVGLGQAAAAGQASNIGTAAGNISQIGINQGNTMAGIDANTIAGITKAVGGGVDSYMTMQALNALNSQGG